jgi:subfamily B ATP-binding cassette protein HlyB/CyaB
MFDRAARAAWRVCAAPYVDIAVLTALATLLQDVTSVSGAPSQLRDSSAALGSHDANRGDVHAAPAYRSSPSSQLRFENIVFRYRAGSPEILRDLSLEIRAGEVVGIVGRSGSGKSTLTKLLQRLYMPERGRVMVDGLDIALLAPAWLRRQIGVVLQENVLFNRSIRRTSRWSIPRCRWSA